MLSGFHPRQPCGDGGDALLCPFGALVAVEVQPERSSTCRIQARVVADVERVLERAAHVTEIRRRAEQVTIGLQHVGR